MSLNYSTDILQYTLTSTELYSDTDIFLFNEVENYVDGRLYWIKNIYVKPNYVVGQSPYWSDNDITIGLPNKNIYNLGGNSYRSILNPFQLNILNSEISYSVYSKLIESESDQLVDTYRNVLISDEELIIKIESSGLISKYGANTLLILEDDGANFFIGDIIIGDTTGFTASVINIIGAVYNEIDPFDQLVVDDVSGFEVGETLSVGVIPTGSQIEGKFSATASYDINILIEYSYILE